MRRRIRLVLVLGLLATVALSTACGSGSATVDQSGGTTTTPSPPGLAGRTFLSQSVTVDGTPHPLAGGQPISITFEGDHLRARPGCNLVGATYRLDGDQLVVDGWDMTDMACTDSGAIGSGSALMDQDTWFTDLLTTDARFTLDGTRLTITSGATVIALVDREVADPDRPLVGTEWTLDSMVGELTAGSVPAGVTATLTLSSDTTMTWGACNRSSATASVADTTVAITDTVSTLKACPSATAEIDSRMAAVLTGTISYEIEGPVLRVRNGATGLDFRAP